MCRTPPIMKPGRVQCKGQYGYTFGLFLYANHYELKYLLRGVTRPDYYYCRSWLGCLADRLRCHLLNLFVALQLEKKNETKRKTRIQSQPKTMGRQSKVHVTPADNEPCIMFPSNCLFAAPSSQQKVAGV